MGLSEDEYWDEYIRDKMEYFIIVSKTKAALIDKYVKSGELEESAYGNYNDEKYLKFVDSYIDNLIKSVDVKIIDISD